LGKLTLNELLNALEHQVLLGKTYLAITVGLREAEPVVRGAAPTFFGLMSDGSAILAQMALARLYDENGGRVTIEDMLDLAAEQPCSFQGGASDEVHAAIARARSTVNSLGSVLAAITHRRNTWFAHIDPRAIRDPGGHEEKAKLTLPQLQEAFARTEEIVKEFTRLLDGRIGPIQFMDDNDFTELFTIIRGSVAAKMKEFDKQFEARVGHPPPQP
jgi:hypothetical protein